MNKNILTLLGTPHLNGHPHHTNHPWKYTTTPITLTRLSLTRHGADADTLHEWLYPGQPPNRPRIHRIISDIRQHTGPDTIPPAHTGTPYQLNTHRITTDTRTFARLTRAAKHATNNAKPHQAADHYRTALALIKGRPLNGYDHEWTDGINTEWANPVRTILQTEIAQAAIHLTNHDLHNHNPQTAFHTAWKAWEAVDGGHHGDQLRNIAWRAANLTEDPALIIRAGQMPRNASMLHQPDDEEDEANPWPPPEHRNAA